MGGGSYSKVIYGVVDILSMNKKFLGANEDAYDELTCSKHADGVDFSYEGSSPYAGVPLAIDGSAERNLGIGVCPVSELAARIASVIAKGLPKAIKKWEAFAADARKKGWVVPEATVIWVDDYD